jgi:hypothetical protein
LRYWFQCPLPLWRYRGGLNRGIADRVSPLALICVPAGEGITMTQPTTTADGRNLIVPSLPMNSQRYFVGVTILRE